MHSLKIFIFITVVALLSSCAGPEPLKKMKYKYIVFSKSKPDVDCMDRGELSVATHKLQESHLPEIIEKQAKKMRANFILVSNESHRETNGMVGFVGKAFFCPNIRFD